MRRLLPPGCAALLCLAGLAPGPAGAAPSALARAIALEQIGPTVWPNLVLAALLIGVALAVRPWRAVAPSGPPWAWLAWVAVLPLLWGTDRIVDVPLIQPLSGAPLLVLMAGWPLGMLMLPPVALLLLAAGGLEPAQALHRLVWLGLVPGTLSFGIGIAMRRLLPRQPFVFILGRAFVGTWLALVLAGGLALAWTGPPHGSEAGDVMLGRGLAAAGDAFMTGMLTAIFVAYRPQWLATWSDPLYLGSGPASAADLDAR